ARPLRGGAAARAGGPTPGDDARPGRRSGPPRRGPRPAVLLAPVPHPAWGEPVGASGAAPLNGGRGAAERTRGRIVRLRAIFRRELARNLPIPDRRGCGPIRRRAGVHHDRHDRRLAAVGAAQVAADGLDDDLLELADVVDLVLTGAGEGL